MRWTRSTARAPDRINLFGDLGDNMRDTIDLLEAIGADARLRHASPAELALALEAAGASAGLRELAATGDATALTRELGLLQMQVEHSSQTGGHEGDDHDDHHHHHEDDDDDDDGDGQDDGADDDPDTRPDDPLPG
jgi:hypothetical protein